MAMKLLRWVGIAGLTLATQACVVRDSPSVNAGYYPGIRTASVSVATPQPYAVSTMPPDPLFEQMTPSPGYGHVWIDGSWHWNGYEWVWVSGRWEQEQTNHVYVSPYYDYSGDTYIYTPGYWSTRDRLPRGSIVRDHRDGRPARVVGGTPYRPTPGGARPQPTGPRVPTNLSPSPLEPVSPRIPPNRRPPPSPPQIGGGGGPITAPTPYDPAPLTTGPTRPDRGGYDPNVGGTYRPPPFGPDDPRPIYPSRRPPPPNGPPAAPGGYRPPPPGPAPIAPGGYRQPPRGPITPGGYQPPQPAPVYPQGGYGQPPQQPAPVYRQPQPAPQGGHRAPAPSNVPARTAPPPPPPSNAPARRR